MEAIGSSETSVATQRTTRRYIPEVDTLNIGLLWAPFCAFAFYTEIYVNKMFTFFEDLKVLEGVTNMGLEKIT
jgi:hypothetical protein